jgi:hypothetical protein
MCIISTKLSAKLKNSIKTQKRAINWTNKDTEQANNLNTRPKRPKPRTRRAEAKNPGSESVTVE